MSKNKSTKKGSSKNKYCYAFCIWGGDRYIPAVLACAYSIIRLKTKNDIVCLVTNDVSEKGRNEIRKLGVIIVEVPYLTYKTAQLKTKKQRKLHFGDSRYEQYKDRTKLQLYKKKNHNTRKRLQNYYSRHSGTKNRKTAISKEIKKSDGYYTPKILSHKYLW